MTACKKFYIRRMRDGLNACMIDLHGVGYIDSLSLANVCLRCKYMLRHTVVC